MNKKQKYYCYALTEVALSNDDNRTPTYVRENVQSNESFLTVQNAFDRFLEKECYDANIDSEIQFQTSFNDGLEIISIGFSKMLREDGSKPTEDEYLRWQAGKIDLIEHTYMIVIYEFECRSLTLRQIKRNLKQV